VKVQTQWQKTKNKTTNWIHVQTPDAGKSGKVASNRGLVTIPEEGDTIMLGFEYGNPSRPYVAGSIFTEKTGTGGGAGNKSKSLTTRSGSTVTLDDETGSVLIKDQIGSQMMFDGAKSISINCEKMIAIQCGPAYIILDGEANSITLSAKDVLINSDATMTINGGTTVDVIAGTNLTAAATENASINAMAEAIVSGTAKTVITAMGEVALDGAIIKLRIAVCRLKQIRYSSGWNILLICGMIFPKRIMRSFVQSSKKGMKE
jgi:uncharacterized protein involved in type VI secretion and phage assembly